MRPPGSKFKGLLLHAAHEQARSERSSLECSDPVYEVREAPLNRTLRSRKWTRGWAEKLLSRWLVTLGAQEEEQKIDFRGADLTVRSACVRGKISATLLSPFKIERGVAALCEPWLLRVELGDMCSTPEAWAVDFEYEEGCLFVAASEGKCDVVILPTIRTGLWSLFDGEGMALKWLQVKACLEKASLVFASKDRAHREMIWDISNTSGKRLASLRRAKIGRGHSHKYLKSKEARTIVDAMWSSKVFEDVEVSRGSKWGRTASTIIEGDGRGVEPTLVTLDSRIRGRSRGLGIDLHVDIFRITFPSRAHPAATIIPHLWAAASLEAREDRAFETSDRLSVVPGSPRAHFWMTDEELQEGGFKRKLEGILADVLSSHDGPYR